MFWEILVNTKNTLIRFIAFFSHCYFVKGMTSCFVVLFDNEEKKAIPHCHAY